VGQMRGSGALCAGAALLVIAMLRATAQGGGRRLHPSPAYKKAEGSVRNEKGKITLFSNHKGSLLGRQPGAA